MADDDFGYTAWGRDWVRLAQPLRVTRPDPRLPRARALAKGAKVEVTISAGRVRGTVEHGRTTPEVFIEVAPMPSPALDIIAAQLRGTRTILTDDMYDACTERGHPPAPTLTRVACTCSDSTGRCVHVLAVFYDMARRIDDDPRLALDVLAPSDGTHESAAVPQRWTALEALDPADYFTVR
ncbi:hypothetical protein CH254_16065 [Rhodococcus sp. 06-412-2C]|uniref:hypothetical protein n=1 Tax=unclassified Rhodococcus (in: high G+C Gram-positive bacteria) TaxID=192944 RepID=UPI000B9A2ED0|nr:MULTISPECIES: hypothetical protein [unclassified Rhodococcus (in: high G+C Gram-positive bacteria)]OZC87189.1 hypothetical protein CH254_16065 [Rhodococcus sp. 06-412-2C]OZD00629.1 hypothetical protein CH279_06430 [Rhodococcus sp. 06-412-2B]